MLCQVIFSKKNFDNVPGERHNSIKPTKGVNMKQKQKQLTLQFSPELEKAIREFAAANGQITLTSAVRLLVAAGLKNLK